MKPVVWLGSSKKDLKRFPESVQDEIGRDLLRVQRGAVPRTAKPLRGFGGAGVFELVEDLVGNTYRAVYIAKLASAVYVLHVFQKKSKTGSETAKHDIDLIRRRLAEAERIHRRG